MTEENAEILLPIPSGLAATSDADAEPAIAPPKFCRACGRPWDPVWQQCPGCAPGVVARALPASPLDDERPRITSVLALYFSLLAVSAVGLIASLAGAGELGLDIGLGIGISVVVLAWCVFAGRKPVLLQLLKPAAPKWFGLALITGLATFSLAYAVIEVLHRFAGLEKLGMSPVYLHNGFGLGMVILMICVQPALFEELAFRGVILTALQPTLSATEAVFVSALMFMVLHLSPGMFPHTLALGLAAGFLRLKTGSLLPCILMHFVHNLMCVAMETQFT